VPPRTLLVLDNVDQALPFLAAAAAAAAQQQAYGGYGSNIGTPGLGGAFPGAASGSGSGFTPGLYGGFNAGGGTGSVSLSPYSTAGGSAPPSSPFPLGGGPGGGMGVGVGGGLVSAAAAGASSIPGSGSSPFFAPDIALLDALATGDVAAVTPLPAALAPPGGHGPSAFSTVGAGGGVGGVGSNSYGAPYPGAGTPGASGSAGSSGGRGSGGLYPPLRSVSPPHAPPASAGYPYPPPRAGSGLSVSRQSSAAVAPGVLAAVKGVLEVLLLRVPHLSVLATSRAGLGGIRYVGEMVHHVAPLSTEDAAGMLALLLGSALRATGLTFERACELVNAAEKNPARIQQLAASMRAAAAASAL
jgi:hypothetical protein